MTLPSAAVDWVRTVPPSWQTTPLGYLVRAEGGGTPSKDEPRYWGGSIPWVTPKDLKTDLISGAIDTVTDDALRESVLRIIRPPTVLTVVRGMILAHTLPVGLTTVPVTVNQDMKALVPGSRVTAPFLAWVLRAFQPGFLSLVEEAGHGTKKLRTDLWTKFPIPQPPLHVQHAIADFLDKKTAAIDALIAKKERLIELLQEKRQALITQAVTKGLDPNVAMKDSGLHALGIVPEHWTVSRIRYEARLVSKGTTPSTVGREMTTSGIRFLKAENLLDGHVRPEPEFYIDEETDRLLQRSRLHAHDLLIVIAGATTGKSAVLQDDLLPANTNQAVCFVRLKQLGLAVFLRAFFSTRYVQDLVWLSAVQAAQPNLSMENIRSFPCLVPPKDEMRRIVEHLQAVEEAHARLTGAILAQLAGLREYRQALITAAVTGKLDVTKHATADAKLTELEAGT